jgi:hypothetical protein
MRSGMTLAEWEDRESIRELIAHLNWLSDDGRLDELLAQFTDDLTYEVEGIAIFHDKASLRCFYEQVFDSFCMRIHRTSNQIIELLGDRANSKCYWRADLDKNGLALVSGGCYFDDLVRMDGVWRVKSRRATMAYLSPLDEGWARTRHFSLT